MGSFNSEKLARRKKIQDEIQQKIGATWILTGELDKIERQQLVEIVSFVYLAGLNLGPVPLSDYLQMALASSTPVVIDEGQKELYPPIWTHGENCILLPRNRFQIKAQVLADQIRNFPSRSQFQDKNRALMQSLVDSPTNEIRRLFNKALSVKSSS